MKLESIFQNYLLHIFFSFINFWEHFFRHPYHLNAISFTLDAMLNYRKGNVMGNITIIMNNYPKNAQIGGIDPQSLPNPVNE